MTLGDRRGPCDFRRKSKKLFGRACDLTRLGHDVETHRITFVRGKRRVGKTTLAKVYCELRCRQDGWQIGYYSGTGAEKDLLRYALRDAFIRWVSQAHIRERAASYIKQNKKELATETGKFLAGIMKLAGKGTAIEALGEAFERGISALAGVSAKSGSGALGLVPIPCEIVKENLNLLAAMAKQRILLVLDAWELSTRPEWDIGILRDMLDDPVGWPGDLRILLIYNARARANKHDNLREELCGRVSCQDYVLGLLDLDSSQVEQERVVRFIRSKVPAARLEDVDRAWLLDALDSYPGVLEAWIDVKPKSLEQLRSLAADAHRQRHSELINSLKELITRNPQLASNVARLSILPELPTRSSWRAVSSCVSGGLSDRWVTELAMCGVLSGVDPPSFGHRTRYEAARHWFRQAQPVLVAQLVDELARCVSGLLGVSGEISLAPIGLLSAVLDGHPGGELPKELEWVNKAVSFLGDPRKEVPNLGQFALDGAKLAREAGAFVVLVALVLSRAYSSSEPDELQVRETLLNKLRGLCDSHEDKLAVREVLAHVLRNAYRNATERGDMEQRDKL